MKVICDRCEKKLDMDIHDRVAEGINLTTQLGYVYYLCDECEDAFWLWLDEMEDKE